MLVGRGHREQCTTELPLPVGRGRVVGRCSWGVVLGSDNHSRLRGGGIVTNFAVSWFLGKLEGFFVTLKTAFPQSRGVGESSRDHVAAFMLLVSQCLGFLVSRKDSVAIARGARSCSLPLLVGRRPRVPVLLLLVQAWKVPPLRPRKEVPSPVGRGRVVGRCSWGVVLG